MISNLRFHPQAISLNPYFIVILKILLILSCVEFLILGSCIDFLFDVMFLFWSVISSWSFLSKGPKDLWKHWNLTCVTAHILPSSIMGILVRYSIFRYETWWKYYWPVGQCSLSGSTVLLTVLLVFCRRFCNVKGWTWSFWHLKDDPLWHRPSPTTASPPDAPGKYLGKNQRGAGGS